MFYLPEFSNDNFDFSPTILFNILIYFYGKVKVNKLYICSYWQNINFFMVFLHYFFNISNL